MSAAPAVLLLLLGASAMALDDDRLSWVRDAAGYELVYLLDLHSLHAKPVYDRDRSAEITKPFDRVAYLLELRRPEGMLFYVWVSMDAFTSDPRRLGVPTGWTFQQRVTRLRVESNAAAVTAGEVPEGNLEFWPGDYRGGNVANVPGARDDIYDCGDEPHPGEYGSMQVHDFAARQTLFALNHWRTGDKADLGIGNAPGQHPDWTFTGNAGDYQLRRLRVFVHPRAAR